LWFEWGIVNVLDLFMFPKSFGVQSLSYQSAWMFLRKSWIDQVLEWWSMSKLEFGEDGEWCGAM
jgi:hypothetical protein